MLRLSDSLAFRCSLPADTEETDRYVLYFSRYLGVIIVILRVTLPYGIKCHCWMTVFLDSQAFFGLCGRV